MIRLFVGLALLHHIEGVCKPWSAAGDAMRRVLAGFVDAALRRDTVPAALRAAARQAEAVARAAGRQEQRRQAIERRPGRPAIGVPPIVVPGWVEHVHQVERER